MVRLTTEYIAKNNGNTKKKKDETTGQYLKRITHLYMTERKIEEVDNLSQCRNLTVLYLYDNQLKKTINLSSAPNLTHLYLQNNSIKKIEDLNCLKKLTKLYLGHNNLMVIEGLQSLQMLQELHVEHQRLPPGEKLLFDPRTLFSISASLQVLNVSGNHLDSFKSLLPLSKLVQLQARDNEIVDFEGIADALCSWNDLTQLDLTGNAITNLHKYRDRIIVMSRALEKLDDKNVSKMERQFLVRWKASRDAKRRRDSCTANTTTGLNKQQSRQQHHPPLSASVFNPTSQYIIKGLPGGQKRFEAVLAKSRSLPNSALIDSLQRIRLPGDIPASGTVFQSRQSLLAASNVQTSATAPSAVHPATLDASNQKENEEEKVESNTQEQGDVIANKAESVQEVRAEGELSTFKKHEIEEEEERPSTQYIKSGFIGGGLRVQNRGAPTTAPHNSIFADTNYRESGGGIFEGKLPESQRRRYPSLRGSKRNSSATKPIIFPSTTDLEGGRGVNSSRSAPPPGVVLPITNGEV